MYFPQTVTRPIDVRLRRKVYILYNNSYFSYNILYGFPIKLCVCVRFQHIQQYDFYNIYVQRPLLYIRVFVCVCDLERKRSRVARKMAGGYEKKIRQGTGIRGPKAAAITTTGDTAK